MTRRSRYAGYMKGIHHMKSRKTVCTKESVLTRLKSLKDKEFIMTIPTSKGETDES